ncbi:metallophosphoesterase family protein [Paracoccus nototheniae]|uniref:Metallophosphoesterase family protein n=2 Tax=Paracoccus nototheniae TaxID=2489002 RepID=A0ABW4E3C2_9RHOB
MPDRSRPVPSLLCPPLGERIGVISDTHGLLRPEALEALKGVGLILHAGDISDPGHPGLVAV